MNYLLAQLRHSPWPACAAIPSEIPVPEQRHPGSRDGPGHAVNARHRHRQQHRLFPDCSIDCSGRVRQGSKRAAGTAAREVQGTAGYAQLLLLSLLAERLGVYPV